MPKTSPRTIGLDLEDFRRLGVRPNESRTSVIRRAAARSAKGLAEKQLAHPSDQRGRQLSRVATSTYRLLDPRKRHDVIQRVHVGRILPNTLSWAAQTKFYSEPDNTGLESPFSRDSLSDSDLIEMLDLDAAPRVDDEDDSWATSLRDRDLLEPMTWHSGVSRVRSQFRYSLVLLAVSGIAIGTVLGFATLGSHDIPFRIRGDKAKSAAGTVPDPRVLAERAVDDDAAELPRSNQSHPAAEPGEDTGAADQVAADVGPDSRLGSDPSSSGGLESAARKPEGEPPVESPVAELPVTELPVADPAPDTVIAPKVDRQMLADSEKPSPSDSQAEVGPPNQQSGTLGDDGFLPDPFTSRGPMAPPPAMSEVELPELMSPDLPSTAGADDTPSDAAPPEAVVPTVTRHAVPEGAGVAAARTQLVSLLPQLASVVRPEDAAQRIAQIEALESDLSVGSADFWTARMMVAEIAWLVEDVDKVSNRLASLTENYDVSLHRVLSDSFAAACGSAALPESQQHLVDNGLRLASRLMIAESLPPCRNVVGAIGPLAESLERDASIEYLQQFSQALDQMERLAESSKHMFNEAGEVDTDGDVGIGGRYYCLMLRRWDVGLPWLAKVSDPRLAGLARKELRLAGDASADELITLAQRWFAAASRSSGHASDSMRLHAIDILRRARSEATGLKKLETDRLIDVNVELLPPFLRESPTAAATQDGSTPSPSTSPDTGSQKPASKEPKNGLRGRIEVDGEDIGVQIDYELDVPMTGAMVERIADRLSRTLSGFSMRLVGQIELEQTETVLVSIAPSQQGVSQRVEFDDTKLEFDPLENTAKVTAGAGKHQVVWTIEAEALSRVFLRLRDASTGQRLQVVQPPGAAELPTPVTVAVARKGD